MCPWTTCCYKSNQTVSSSLAFGSSSRPRVKPDQRVQTPINIVPYIVFKLQSRLHWHAYAVRVLKWVIKMWSKVMNDIVDLTWSYSDIATQNIMAVTSSKQCIHFFLSERCPPTSKLNVGNNDYTLDKNITSRKCIFLYNSQNITYSLKLRFLNEKWTSTIPVVLTYGNQESR